jgi:hypothetical protein
MNNSSPNRWKVVRGNVAVEKRISSYIDLPVFEISWLAITAFPFGNIKPHNNSICQSIVHAKR